MSRSTPDVPLKISRVQRLNRNLNQQAHSLLILFEKAAFLFAKKTANGRCSRDPGLKDHRGFSRGPRGPWWLPRTVWQPGARPQGSWSQGWRQAMASSTKLGCWVKSIKNKSLGKVDLFPLPIKESKNDGFFLRATLKGEALKIRLVYKKTHTSH